MICCFIHYVKDAKIYFSISLLIGVGFSGETKSVGLSPIPYSNKLKFCSKIY